MKILKSLCLTLLFLQMAVQPLSAQKIQYGGMQQLGLVFGESDVNTAFSITNGVRFGRFFTGIGTNIQFSRRYYYSFMANNTFAVYADARYYINKKKNFFVKADGGVNYISNELASYTNYNYKKYPGGYAGMGVGFKARIGKEIFYSFDLNYLIKQTRYNYNYLDYRGFWTTEKYNFIQYALVLNMGIEIF